MDWPLLIDFIHRRDPAFLAAVRGVPEDALSAWLGAAGGVPPMSYVEFMRRMGLDSHGFHPFGATQDHGFATILRRLERMEEQEEDAPPGDRFFLVAVETDESLEALQDHYLDLQRRSEDDAPLVLLEPGVRFGWQEPVDAAETFDERLTYGLFDHFQLSGCEQRDVVALGGTLQAGEGRAAMQEALALLLRAGFEPALPWLGRVACLQAGGLSVLARVNEEYELLTLQLGGENRAAVRALADQLLVGLPASRRPAGPRNLD